MRSDARFGRNVAAKMGKKHKNSRSLASRKRVKDVSGAMFENTSFHREASKLNIEPLKAGFDTALPRAFREMQKRIQQVKDAEAGKPVKRYVPHPDMPRPAQPREKIGGKKAKKKGMDEADKDGTVESKGDYAFADSFVRKSKGGGEGQGVAAADAASVGEAGKKRKLEPPKDEAEAAGLPRFHESSRAKGGSSSTKLADFPRAERVKFGSTNDAPPTLLVGGNLKKAANAARASTAQVDSLARQRAAAISAYAEAKKKRRLEQRAE